MLVVEFLAGANKFQAIVSNRYHRSTEALVDDRFRSEVLGYFLCERECISQNGAVNILCALCQGADRAP